MTRATRTILSVPFYLLLVGAADEARRPDLTGIVVDGKGVPVKGATVLVYTAGPRRGTSPI